MSPGVPREQIASALADATSRPPTDHPGLDALIAYRERTLARDEADAVQEHLVSCRRCVDDLLDLDGFVEVDEPPGAADLETAGAWRAFRTRAEASNGRHRILPLAASLLLAVAGFGWAIQERARVDDLRQEVRRLAAPQRDVAILDLFPESTPRSAGRDDGSETSIASRSTTLIVHLPEAPSPPRARAVELVDSDGRVLWAGEATPDAVGTLSLGLPAGFLGAGSYRLRVDSSPDADGPVESFRFAITD